MLNWLWVCVIGGLALTAFTVITGWLLDQPRRSGRRPTGWALGALVAAIIAAVVLAANHTAWWWPVIVLLAGAEAAAKVLSHGAGVRARLRTELEQELHHPDNLLTGPAHQHLRPEPPPAPPTGQGRWRRLEKRLDAWLAADGPTPTAGWWHSGGLVLDRRGPALLDAAGLRHPLPGATTTMVLRLAPRALLLVDERETLLARLPLTGFTPAGLHTYCQATGWTFHTSGATYRPAPDLLDLHRAVVDPAAR